MPTIEPHIKNYIDVAVTSVENRLDKRLGDRFDKRVDRAIDMARKKFNTDMKRHTSALLKKSDIEMKRHNSVLAEDINNKAKEIEIVANKLPSEERIREIVHEEIHPLDTKLNICLSEIREHRKDLDRHEDLISSLELDAV